MPGTRRCDCKRMKESTMTASDLSLDRVEIERRRMLARLRNTREFERQKLLARLLRAEQRAVQLRQWISKIASSEEIREDSGLGRLARWARAELLNLENSTHPATIAEALRQSNLFPEPDELHDPLGDPPPQRPWGRYAKNALTVRRPDHSPKTDVS